MSVIMNEFYIVGVSFSIIFQRMVQMYSTHEFTKRMKHFFESANTDRGSD